MEEDVRIAGHCEQMPCPGGYGDVSSVVEQVVWEQHYLDVLGV